MLYSTYCIVFLDRWFQGRSVRVAYCIYISGQLGMGRGIRSRRMRDITCIYSLVHRHKFPEYTYGGGQEWTRRCRTAAGFCRTPGLGWINA